MDTNRTLNNPNPRQNANVFSILSWWWTLPLFKKGYGKVLGFEDLYEPLKSDQSSNLGDRLEKKWNQEVKNAKKNKKNPSLLKTIFRTFAFEYSMLGIAQVFTEALRLGRPILLKSLLLYFKAGSQETTYEDALLYAYGLVATMMISILSMNQTIFESFHTGGKIRAAVCSLVYRKALRLSKTALGETAPGKVVNLVANDVNRFEQVSIFVHYMWSGPLTTLIIGYFLYSEVGYAGVLGILAVLIVVPIQAYNGRLSAKFRLKTAIKTDERVRLMDEIISGVQVIKMYAWEKPFCALIRAVRRLELKVVRKAAYLRGIFMTFNLFTTRVALYCTLMAMLFTGQALTADRVFVFAYYLDILSQGMSSFFVRGIAELAECMVSVRRLQSFLTLEEFDDGNVDSVFGKNLGCDKLRKGVNFTSEDYEVGFDERNGKERKKQTVTMLNSGALVRAQLEQESDRHDGVDCGVEPSALDRPWAVKLDNVTAKWNLGSNETTLQNIDLEVERGKLYAIIGAVGSGKSSLLSSILGEINLLSGSARVNGSVSFACQEAWVFGASVRQNIIFGAEYDRQRYQKAVKACALLSDFQQFPHGDQTIVGERGSSLSGGQKARINLARAVYRQADVYLLDDPLSAVDSHVGKHLFEECVEGYLKNKTRVLATHQLQYLKGADAIILLEQGRMRKFANHNELLESHPEFEHLLTKDSDEGEAEDELESESGFGDRSNPERRVSSRSGRSRASSRDDKDADEKESASQEQANGGFEATSRGIVEGSLLTNYFRFGSNLVYAFVILALYVLTQFIVSANDYFIREFVASEEKRALLTNISLANDSTVTIENSDVLPTNVYVYVYTFLVFSIFIVGVCRSFVFFSVCLRCSQRLHDAAFGALIRTTKRFFDTNPSGRILNRFSKDMGAVDEILPKTMLDAGQAILVMIGGLTVSCTVNPMFLAPICVIAVLFYWIRKVYLKTSKNVKRLEGMTRSPVFTHLNATLNGLSTIRAYGAQKILKLEFDKSQDVHTSSWFIFVATSTAFGFVLDIFCFIFTSIVVFSFLVLNNDYSGSSVGLAITQSISLTGLIQWGMRQSAEVTNQLMSVERVLEYSKLPSEPNLRDKDAMILNKKKDKKKEEDEFVQPPENWPTAGCVQFKRVELRYADEEAAVLKDLSLKIEASEKIGIVGRTGAGKSSLISALFRLAKVKGVIEIDGIDTGSIAVEDLRKHISIIPQDPVLFSGTLRRNLDPFNEFSDQHLWDVLEEVDLKDAVEATGRGLDNLVLDRGANYSVGQRQLICLARAILRSNRILMLDEATANVDANTDSLIQKTIRTKFASCTVLTIAHRLNTIMDSDKILVMDNGHLVEFDHPHVLLQNETGYFTSLVKECGESMYEQLCQVASDAFIDSSKRTYDS